MDVKQELRRNMESGVMQPKDSKETKKRDCLPVILIKKCKNKIYIHVNITQKKYINYSK